MSNIPIVLGYLHFSYIAMILIVKNFRKENLKIKKSYFVISKKERVLYAISPKSLVILFISQV